MKDAGVEGVELVEDTMAGDSAVRRVVDKRDVWVFQWNERAVCEQTLS